MVYIPPGNALIIPCISRIVNADIVSEMLSSAFEASSSDVICPREQSVLQIFFCSSGRTVFTGKSSSDVMFNWCIIHSPTKFFRSNAMWPRADSIAKANSRPPITPFKASPSTLIEISTFSFSLK